MKQTREPFTFSLFVPGIRLPTRNGLSAPKPLGKGSLEPLKRPNGSYKKTSRGTLVWGDKPEVYDWVNRIAGTALARRSQIIAGGYDPFPYRGPVKASACFLYERAPTQRTGYPTNIKGIYAQHDLDKLQRALGDAITPTRDPNYPMGDIIEDDRWITTWAVSKRFVDQVTWAPGAGVIFTIEEEPGDHPDLRSWL